MHKRKHNGITLLTPAFFSRRFKFGTRRAIEKHGQLSMKQVVLNEMNVPRVITNPSWPQAVREYYEEKGKAVENKGFPYGVTLASSTFL